MGCLYARHTHCVQETLFPVAFSIHELDDIDSNKIIIENFSRHLQSALDRDYVLFTDGSETLLHSCLITLPTTITLCSSWPNILESVNQVLLKNNIPEDEKASIVCSVQQLLDTANIEQYQEVLTSVYHNWNASFREFYDSLLSHVLNASNVAGLKQLNMFSEYGLVLSGCSKMLKNIDDMLSNCEVSIESLCKTIYFLFYHYRNEMDRGLIPNSTSRFRRKEAHAPRSKKKQFFPHPCALSEDILFAMVQKMKQSSLEQQIIESDRLIGDCDVGDCNIEVDVDEDQCKLLDESKIKKELTFMGQDHLTIISEEPKKFSPEYQRDNAEQSLKMSSTSAVFEALLVDAGNTVGSKSKNVSKSIIQKTKLNNKVQSSTRKVSKKQNRAHLNNGFSAWKNGMVRKCNTGSRCYLVPDEEVLHKVRSSELSRMSAAEN